MNSINVSSPSGMLDGLLEAAQFLPRSMNTTNAWCGHLPFASWLIQQFRPQCLVELGTHTGNSYFTMCQTVQNLGLHTRCYAVDTWQGDEHAGTYGDRIFNAVQAHNQEYYESFSRLLRMFFDEAVEYFADGSIDLLHIDGLHTYEAVKHDFDTWLPKMMPGGVIMFHDTNVRERDFGVWQLWKELQERYPENIEFVHSNGLGVLQLPGGPEERRLPWLAADFPEKQALVLYFAGLGGRHIDRFALDQTRRHAQDLADHRQHLLNEYERHRQEIEQHLREIDQKRQTIEEKDRALQSTQEALNEALATQDTLLKNITELERALAESQERQRHIQELADSVAHGLNVREREIQEILSSTSWRLTRPIRAVGKCFPASHQGQPIGGLRRYIFRPIHRLVSLCLMMLLLLPVSLVRYRPLSAWVGALFRGRGFFTSILTHQGETRARMSKLPGFIRAPLAAALSIGNKLYHNSVLTLARNALRVMTEEGGSGLRTRLRGNVPTAEVVQQKEPGDPRRILVADNRIPMADVSAGERATVGILRDLCRLGYQVTLLPANLVPAPRYEAELGALGVEVITHESGYTSAVDYVAQQGHKFGVFYLIRVDVAEALLDTARLSAPYARFIFHAPDLYFLREMRAAELLGDPAALAAAEHTRSREVAIMSKADHVVVVSAAEKPLLEPLVPDTPVSVFPALYAAVNESPPPYEGRQHIFFLGGFGHSPNRDAVLWFVESVWPLVHSALPEVEFHVIGAEVPADIQALDSHGGVRVVGYVEDLDPVFNEYRLGVAPLRYGAGIKGKVAMTMGAGVPCICTDIAAEGMHLRDGVHTLLADEPEAFAEAIVRAYNDPELWQRLSINGREQVRLAFGDTVNRNSLLTVLDNAEALPHDLFLEYCKRAEPHALPPVQEGAVIDASIIIEADDNDDATRACLNSILETCSGADLKYEVIVAVPGEAADAVSGEAIDAEADAEADAGAETDAGIEQEASEVESARVPPAVARLMADYPGLQVAVLPADRNPEDALDELAEGVQGTYVLFLENRTVVLPGWLEAEVNALTEAYAEEEGEHDHSHDHGDDHHHDHAHDEEGTVEPLHTAHHHEGNAKRPDTARFAAAARMMRF